MDIIKILQEELGIRRGQVETTIKLIDEGNTIPFIARYRKEMTGSLDDETLRNFHERLLYLRNLEERKEAIKKNIGSAFPGTEIKEMEVKGRNLSEGIPRAFTISSNEILEALTDPLNNIVSAVKNALEQIPPELGADIAEKGMMLTGGGALLHDIDRLLMEETGLPVLIAEEPLTCVVRGCGIALEKIDELGTVFSYE